MTTLTDYRTTLKDAEHKQYFIDCVICHMRDVSDIDSDMEDILVDVLTKEIEEI